MEFVRLVLYKLGLADKFNQIVSADEVEHGKPAPDIFLLAAKRLNKSAEECIVIEDGISGMEAAKAAGMKCIGLVEDLDKKYPTNILVTELGEVIDKIIIKTLCKPRKQLKKS